MNEKIELEITPEDLAKAQSEYKVTELAISRSCIVFQACKRAGLKPVDCAYSYLGTESGPYVMDKRACAITDVMDSDWHKFVGAKFSVWRNP